MPEDRQHNTIKLLYDGSVRLCLSPALANEIWDVLTRDELRARFPALSADRAKRVLEAAKMHADWFERVPNVFTWLSHPDDDHVFNLAIHAKANYLVTWEKRILKLATDTSPVADLLRSLAPDLAVVTPKQLADYCKSPGTV